MSMSGIRPATPATRRASPSRSAGWPPPAPARCRCRAPPRCSPGCRAPSPGSRGIIRRTRPGVPEAREAGLGEPGSWTGLCRPSLDGPG